MAVWSGLMTCTILGPQVFLMESLLNISPDLCASFSLPFLSCIQAKWIPNRDSKIVLMYQRIPKKIGLMTLSLTTKKIGKKTNVEGRFCHRSTCCFPYTRACGAVYLSESKEGSKCEHGFCVLPCSPGQVCVGLHFCLRAQVSMPLPTQASSQHASCFPWLLPLCCPTCCHGQWHLSVHHWTEIPWK